MPVAVCPKCGWKTRELEPQEVDEVNRGLYRCSGQCFSPNPPFSPILKMEASDQEAKNAH